jgi:hypothetical protein
MKKRTWMMMGVAVGILTAAAVWADTTRKPSKDYIIVEIEEMPGDQIKFHVIRPGQRQKVMEIMVGVTEKKVTVSDEAQPGVTTTLIKGDVGGGGGKLVIAKWLDGSGTVPTKEVGHDESH